MKYIKNYIRI